MTDVKEIIEHVQQRSGEIGMQASAFKIGDYNTQVTTNYPDGTGEKMKLDYPDNTLAFTVAYNSVQYPQFMDAVNGLAPEFANIKQRFCTPKIRYIPANEMNPSTQLPVCHVQTAGNASGSAFYYQETQVTAHPSTWGKKKIFGISINNKFRLGTAFAAVLVFEDIQSDAFHPQPPIDVYFTEAEKIMLLSWVNGLAKPSMTHPQVEHNHAAFNA